LHPDNGQPFTVRWYSDTIADVIKRPISVQLLIPLVILPVLALLLAGCGGMVNIVTATPDASQMATLTATNAPANQQTEASATRRASTATRRPAQTSTAFPKVLDGLQTITPAELPPEARQTLALIDSGGPFPYSRDGIVFQNREGILPKKGSGYYHEYTVVTPGSQDRGARRLIAGSNDEIYYTDDHYATFERVIR
jgi:ribonuclease T1